MAINGQLTFPDVPGRISEHNQSPTAHSVRIDNTLTQSGMAADAKAVKDKIDEVTGDIDADIDALDGQVTDLKSALDNVMMLPPDGVSGQVLVSNGNGGADWTDLASGDQLADGDGVSY